jgi:hypothetical protein
MPPSRDARSRDEIIASVEADFAEQIAHTQELVCFRSIRGAEHAIQDFVFRTFRSRGFAMERFAMEREAIERHAGGGKFSDVHSTAPVVVGIHRPREERGRSLILQAHVDVVPPGPADLWTHPPFDPVISGDWLALMGYARHCAASQGQQGCRITAAAMEMMPDDGEISALFSRMFRRMQDLFAGAVIRGQASGESPAISTRGRSRGCCSARSRACACAARQCPANRK